jgi:hypothetical protein
MKGSAPHAIEIEPRSVRRSQVDPGGLAPEPPCTGCPYAVTCRTHQLACKAFLQYLKSGRWKVLPALRLPTRRPYQRLFRN